jgi:hypothetical protein
MSEDESAMHAKLTQRLEKQFSLCCGRPNNVSGPIAVAVPGAIEHDDPVIFGSQFDQAARFKILDHAAVTMEKNQRSARAALHVVNPDAIHLKESSSGRIVALCFFGKLPIKNCRSS